MLQSDKDISTDLTSGRLSGAGQLADPEPLPLLMDESLAAAMRLVSLACSPMALIGRRGILVANLAGRALFAAASENAVDGRSGLESGADSRDFLAAVLGKTFAGEAQSLPDWAVSRLENGASATRWFNLDVIPVTGVGGNVLAALVTASETTHHIEAQRHLSEAEQRLRVALEGSGMVGIWTLDVATNLCTADATVAIMYGLSATDFESGIDDRLFLQAIHPDDLDKVKSSLEQAITHNIPYRCRYRILSKKGLHWVIASAKPACDETGKVLRLLGVIVDVTDQMETASALAESRFRFQTLTEALPQIVWSCDGEGKHDYFSARWSEFTGVSHENISEETWKQLVFPEHWSMVSAAWDKALRTGEPYDLDYRFRHHTGDYRWLRVMALPLQDDEGCITRWFGTSTDVHDAYLAAEERERLAAELERIATEDQLTRVLTRRAFIQRAGELLAAPNIAKSISLLMLDIDHFKSINDTFGHPGGDKVLSIAALRMKASAKQTDLVGRLGGEEFALLLSDCSLHQAMQIAERIRYSMEAEPFSMSDGREVIVTVSIGVTASLPPHDLDQLLLLADKALYEAKEGGRNRAVLSQDGLSFSAHI